MKSLADQLGAYAGYHEDLRNKLTHFLGVPLVTFAIFLGLGWLRFVHAPDLPCTGATLFYLVVAIYYLGLDWKVALCQAPFSVSSALPAEAQDGTSSMIEKVMPSVCTHCGSAV